MFQHVYVQSHIFPLLLIESYEKSYGYVEFILKLRVDRLKNLMLT